MTFLKTADSLNPGARTLSRKYYAKKKILKQEYKNIFLNHWICAGRTEDIAKPSHYITLDIGDESVIILRDNKGILKAFFNVCRHRGTRIRQNNKGTFSKTIQCGYHGWTYNLDGNLVGAPHMDNVDNFNKEDYPLHSVAIEEWEGFLFLNLDDHPENFGKKFEPILDRFSSWNLDHLAIKESRIYNVNCNWKLIIQNFCECYHCPIIHPQLAEIHNYMGGRNDLYKGPFLGGYMDFNEGKESITTSSELCCPPIKGVDGDDLRRVYYYSIFPNLLLSLHPEYVMYHTVWPVGINKCTVKCSWLFSKEIVKSNKYTTGDAIDFWDKTNKQDWAICELSYLGIQSKKYEPAPYSGQESLLAAYDNYYLQHFKK